jgi:hypothetical protein
MTRPPRGSMSKSRSYQHAGWNDGSPMPLAADSGGNGTRIVSGQLSICDGCE